MRLMIKFFQRLVWNAHVLFLCLKNRISIHRVWVCPGRSFSAFLLSSASPSERRIRIGPIRGPISYIVALHEIGHVQTFSVVKEEDKLLTRLYSKAILNDPLTKDERDLVVISELLASDWAIQNSIMFAPLMGRALSLALYTYDRKVIPCP